VAQGTATASELVETGAQDGGDDTYDSGRIFLISGGHLAHDLYSSFMGVLIPAVQDKLGLSLAMVSLMIPAQQLPGIVQPYFGYLADKTTRKWFVVIAPSVTAISISSIGLAPNVAVVLLLLIISAISSAAFHAPAVALVGELGGKRMGSAMSIFMALGDSARTFGPIMLTAAIALFTLRGSFVVVVFGLAASVILYFTLDTHESDEKRKAEVKRDVRSIVLARRIPLTALFAVSVINGLAISPYTYFLDKFLVSNGHSEWYGGIALSLLSAAGIAGGLLAGSVSDRLGRRLIFYISAIASGPLFFLYLWLENGSWQVLLLLMAAGFACFAVRPVTLTVAQEIMPEARAATAGMMLAVGVVGMSIAAPAFGALADVIGLHAAFWAASATSFLSLPFIGFLPGRNGGIRRTTVTG
jgi:MFS transporter, FSR family, fosmidomycin resistance protein